MPFSLIPTLRSAQKVPFSPAGCCALLRNVPLLVILLQGAAHLGVAQKPQVPAAGPAIHPESLPVPVPGIPVVEAPVVEIPPLLIPLLTPEDVAQKSRSTPISKPDQSAVGKEIRAIAGPSKPLNSPAPAEGPVVESWLTRVDAHFKSLYEKEVTVPFSISMENARNKFLLSIDTAVSAAYQAGRAQEGAALEKEREQFLANGNMAPVEDSDRPSEFVKKARSLFRSEVRDAYNARVSNTTPLQIRYDGVLQKNLAVLVQRQMQAEARVLSDQRTRISQAWRTPENPYSKAVPAEVPLPSASPDHFEKAIQWVLDHGGKVKSRSGHRFSPVVFPSDLRQQRSGILLAFTGKKLSPNTSEEQFRSLAPLESCVSLRFSDVPIGNEAFQFLASWTSLESLSIQTGLVTDPLAEKILHLSSLETLTLMHCRGITSGFFSLLKGHLPRLKKLVLSGDQITDECISFLAFFPQLQVLRLDHTEITDEGAAQLSRLRNLRELSLIGTRVTPKGLAALSGLPLQSLGFLSTEMPNFAACVEALDAAIPSLEGVSLGGNEATEETILALKRLKSLRSIDFKKNDVSPGLIESLGDLHGIESLSFASPSISDFCLPPLKWIRDLKSVSFAGRHRSIGDNGLHILRNCRKLRRIEISAQSGVTPEGAENLEKTVSGLKVVFVDTQPE
jgi:hypothetical protein